MSLSVVVPNYNHAGYLPLALASILAQEPSPHQIIIVDDKSTDDSLAVIERLSQRHPEIELVRHEQNRGPPAALNTGLGRARGKYIAFIGADDLVLPGLFACTVAALERHPRAALACGEVALLGPGERILGFRPFAVPSWRKRFLPPETVLDLIERSDNWIVGTAAVYRRECLDALGGFDETLGSFCDGMICRQLALAHGFCFVPEVLGVWRRGPRTYSSATALRAVENERVLSRTLERLPVAIGPGVAAGYGASFTRRWRFGTAQSMLVWEKGSADVGRLVAAMTGNDRDRRMFEWIRKLAGHGSIGRTLALAWVTHRTRPISGSTLVANGLRSLALSPLRRRRVRQQLDAIALRLRDDR
jgi:hypothetical protein